MNKKKAMLSCLQILLGSMLYGIGTVLFVFPSSLSLGGTSGIAVMLARYLPPSAGFFSVLLNVLLLMVALFVLGRSMAARSFLGSALTTAFIGGG